MKPRQPANAGAKNPFEYGRELAAAELCDRVLMMDGGRVLADGSPDELCRLYADGKADPTLEDVFMHLTGKSFAVAEGKEDAT